MEGGVVQKQRTMPLLIGLSWSTQDQIHQRLLEIMHEVANRDIPTLHNRDITLMTNYVNEVKKILKRIPVRNLSELKYAARTSELLICEKVSGKTCYPINKRN